VSRVTPVTYDPKPANRPPKHRESRAVAPVDFAFDFDGESS
jgi:hypothetical protein